MVVVLDPTLLGPSVAEGVQKDTKLIVNTTESKDSIMRTLELKNIEVWKIDATELAIRVLGRPITNTAMLGAIVKATNSIKLESLLDVVKARFGGKIGELNAQVVQEAYKGVVKE